ncbi:MAG: hypothetical protein KKD73_04260 [Proteobacteria bacterium]|nr:hypothetical protein [Pseudomonadota bacterium]MBU1639666.1 hypothetical protein [Pseudomonadota bacterium]
MKDVNNSGGYDSLVWLRDKDGKEYASSIDTFKANIDSISELSPAEREICLDISLLVGAERWQKTIPSANKRPFSRN